MGRNFSAGAGLTFLTGSLFVFPCDFCLIIRKSDKIQHRNHTA